ncbi:MAG: hypothetical protein KDA96_10190 [Planctomycetaceae bacterium]|nr:hypothetical protein [Planctomycetaceae bacterium]
MFEEPEETDDTLNEADVVILSAENRDDVLALQKKLFPFPSEPGRPREGFYVKHASFGRVSAFQVAAKGKSDAQQLKAMCELIADSVIGPDEQPVWTSKEVSAMATIRTDRFLVIQKAVASFNGLKDDADKVAAMIEAAKKN